MHAVVRVCRLVTHRRLIGLLNVRKNGKPSIKKISPSKCTSLPVGLEIVMILSGIVVVCVVFPFRAATGAP